MSRCSAANLPLLGLGNEEGMGRLLGGSARGGEHDAAMLRSGFRAKAACASASQPAPEADASQSAQEPAGQAAATCPGHPDALGTSRVLALDPTEYPRVGRMQYPDSLPLNDKELVVD